MKIKFPVFRFYLIIFLFSLLFLILLKIKFVQAQNVTILSLTPQSIKKQGGSTFSLEIKIKTEEKILGADIDLVFNPELLEILQITPAGFFPNPQILVNKINSQDGLINFSIFSYPPQQKEGTIATLTIKVKNNAAQSTQIKFQPSTALATVGIKKINFQTNSATIEIIPSKSQPTLSISPTAFTSPPLPPPTISPLPSRTQKPNFLVSLFKTIGTLFIFLGIILFFLVLVIL